VPQAQLRQALLWVSVCHSRGPVGDRVARAQPSIRGQPPPLLASSGVGVDAEAALADSSLAMAAAARMDRQGRQPSTHPGPLARQQP